MFSVRSTLLFNVIIFCYASVAEPAHESHCQAMTTTIHEVKLQHQDQWLKHAEVVSVGIGLNADQKPIIIIGVRRLTPALKQSFPAEVDGYPIELHVIGLPKAQ